MTPKSLKESHQCAINRAEFVTCIGLLMHAVPAAHRASLSEPLATMLKAIGLDADEFDWLKGKRFLDRLPAIGQFRVTGDQILKFSVSIYDNGDDLQNAVAETVASWAELEKVTGASRKALELRLHHKTTKTYWNETVMIARGFKLGVARLESEQDPAPGDRRLAETLDRLLEERNPKPVPRRREDPQPASNRPSTSRRRA